MRQQTWRVYFVLHSVFAYAYAATTGDPVNTTPDRLQGLLNAIDQSVSRASQKSWSNSQPKSKEQTPDMDWVALDRMTDNNNGNFEVDVSSDTITSREISTRPTQTVESMTVGNINGTLILGPDVTTNKKISFDDVFSDEDLWVGLATGVGLMLLLGLLVLLVYTCFKRLKRRKPCIDVKELGLCSQQGKTDPIYVRLSQLHRAKKGAHYIVSVLDDTSIFSLKSDESSEEEELFDISEIKTGHNSFHGPSNKGGMNMTSTPVKKTPSKDKQNLDSLLS